MCTAPVTITRHHTHVTISPATATRFSFTNQHSNFLHMTIVHKKREEGNIVRISDGMEFHAKETNFLLHYLAFGH
jgi:hypothetical protein